MDPNNCRNEESGSTSKEKKRRGSKGFSGEERLSRCFGIIQQMRWGMGRRGGEASVNVRG